MSFDDGRPEDRRALERLCGYPVRLQFTVDGDFCFNPNAASCWVEVDGKIYEIPGGSGVHFA